MVLAADYPFLEIVWTTLVFFACVMWFWIFILVIADVFRRDDLSGWGKAAWSLFALVLPVLGVFVYIVAHGRDMTERRIRGAQGRVEAYGGRAAAADGPAAEIAAAKRLLDSGAIDQAEFEQLKRTALA